MFIVPMNSNINIGQMKSLTESPIKTNPETDSDSDSSFKKIFQDLITNVEQTEAVTKMDSYNLSIGNMDDLHTMMINASKADIALQTMVQLRNKVLDAYTEVMRTNL